MKRLVSGSVEATEAVGDAAAAESMLTSYDQLDFSRPSRDLKQHYHSTSTLKSVKSANGSRDQYYKHFC